MDTTRIVPAIRHVIDEIPPGHIFDSHFVIEMLIRNHPDDYFHFVASFNGTNIAMDFVNGHLAQQIPSCGIPNIQKAQPPDGWSVNTRGNPGECTCWLKQK